MKKRLNYIALLASVALLTACSGNAKQSLGLQKSAPDEFRVISKPPLSVPPNFNLRPPKEGGSYVQRSSVRDEAENVLFNTDNKATASHGRGEDTFLNRIGVQDADPNIRKTLSAEQQRVAATKAEEENKGFFRKLLSTKEEQKPDPIVNPKKESERIRENIKSNEPITKGETPTIDRGNQSVLQKIFSSSDEE